MSLGHACTALSECRALMVTPMCIYMRDIIMAQPFKVLESLNPKEDQTKMEVPGELAAQSWRAPFER